MWIGMQLFTYFTLIQYIVHGLLAGLYQTRSVNPLTYVSVCMDLSHMGTYSVSDLIAAFLLHVRCRIEQTI